jgi:hypothetical protein
MTGIHRLQRSCLCLPLGGPSSRGLASSWSWFVVRKPEILIGRSCRLATRIGTTGPDELKWDQYSKAEQDRRRRVLLFVLNDTGHQQRIVIEPDDLSVVWPRYATRVLVEYRALTLAPHEGGNVDVLIANSASGWPDPAEWPKRIYWIRIRAHTQSGRIVRFFGPIRARPLRTVGPNGLTDYLFHVSRFGFVRPN